MTPEHPTVSGDQCGYRVETDPALGGRILVAATDFAPGDVLFHETPLLVQDADASARQICSLFLGARPHLGRQYVQMYSSAEAEDSPQVEEVRAYFQRARDLLESCDLDHQAAGRLEFDESDEEYEEKREALQTLKFFGDCSKAWDEYSRELIRANSDPSDGPQRERAEAPAAGGIEENVVKILAVWDMNAYAIPSAKPDENVGETESDLNTTIDTTAFAATSSPADSGSPASSAENFEQVLTEGEAAGWMKAESGARSAPLPRSTSVISAAGDSTVGCGNQQQQGSWRTKNPMQRATSVISAASDSTVGGAGVLQTHGSVVSAASDLNSDVFPISEVAPVPEQRNVAAFSNANKDRSDSSEDSDEDGSEDEDGGLESDTTSGSEDEEDPASGHLRGLFPEIALIPHSCAPNVGIDTASGLGVVTALTQIKAGAIISSNYHEDTAFLQWPASVRQLILRERRGFECGCRRCKKELEQPSTAVREGDDCSSEAEQLRLFEKLVVENEIDSPDTLTSIGMHVVDTFGTDHWLFAWVHLKNFELLGMLSGGLGPSGEGDGGDEEMRTEMMASAAVYLDFFVQWLQSEWGRVYHEGVDAAELENEAESENVSTRPVEKERQHPAAYLFHHALDRLVFLGIGEEEEDRQDLEGSENKFLELSKDDSPSTQLRRRGGCLLSLLTKPAVNIKRFAEVKAAALGEDGGLPFAVLMHSALAEADEAGEEIEDERR